MAKHSPSIIKNEAKDSVFFAGISISGGKADRSAVAILEYFPKQEKIFLIHLFDKIKQEEQLSADQKIFEIIDAYSLKSVGLDAPLQLPKCLRCTLKCPGYEVCDVEEIVWMRTQYQAIKKKPRKLFTPYSQRCTDLWLHNFDSGGLGAQHALGANSAPLTARALFLSRRFSAPCFEVASKFSAYLIGEKLKLPKSQLKRVRNQIGGETSRKNILQAMMDQKMLFIYQQDFRLATESLSAFGALVSAYTVFLNHLGKTLPRPKGFPQNEIWLALPNF
jgi:hypothetical protein